MSIPLSFCDISARCGQVPAPQKSIEEQTGWNPKQLFLDYMRKVQEQREKDAKEAEEAQARFNAEVEKNRLKGEAVAKKRAEKLAAEEAAAKEALEAEQAATEEAPAAEVAE